MPSQNDIEAQLKLLATNRRTLEHYIIQRDTLGSAHVPPMVSHGIREARENIQNIKTILRQQKVVVEDLAIDEEVLPDTLTNKNERFKSGYLPPTALKKLRVTELVGLIATVIACIAAVVVVPEIRLFLGLDRSIIPSTTTQTAHIPITSLPSSTIIDSSSSNIPTVPLPNRTAALEPTLAPHTPTPAPTTSVEPTLAPRTPTLAPTTSIMEPATVISIKQPLDTNSEGFVAILESIEIEPGSFMRWNFEFWNKSGSGLDVTAGTSSYVVDDLGNRYAMTTPLVEGLTPGVKIQKSLNFDPPKPGAKLFTLYFRNNLGWPFKQPTMVFPITINTNNTEQPTEIADNPLVIPINQPLETNSPGFVATLISVEKLSDTHMRWNFEFWNKSGVGLDVTAGGGSYIADDLGNRYALITPLTGGLDPGVRSEESIVFEGPREGAKVFTLYLTNNLGWPFRQPTIITSINFDQKL